MFIQMTRERMLSCHFLHIRDWINLFFVVQYFQMKRKGFRVMRKKILSLLLITAMLATTLTGCDTKIKDEKRVEAKALQVEKIKIENKNIIYNENTNTNTIDIKIDLIQVFNQINESKELSNDEKVELQQLIQNAIKEKDKKSLWEKIKNIFGKVADKTFDVAVAVLPVLAEAMLKAKGIL